MTKLKVTFHNFVSHLKICMWGNWLKLFLWENLHSVDVIPQMYRHFLHVRSSWKSWPHEVGESGNSDCLYNKKLTRSVTLIEILYLHVEAVTCSIFSCPSYWIILRVQPTRCNISQIYLFLQDTLHVSDGFFLPLSGAQNCTYSVRYMSDRYCYLLLG